MLTKAEWSSGATSHSTIRITEKRLLIRRSTLIGVLSVDQLITSSSCFQTIKVVSTDVLLHFGFRHRVHTLHIFLACYNDAQVEQGEGSVETQGTGAQVRLVVHLNTYFHVNLISQVDPTFHVALSFDLCYSRDNLDRPLGP